MNLNDFVDGDVALKLASVAAYETGVDLKTLSYKFLSKYADLISAYERKHCAKVCEHMTGPIETYNPAYEHYIKCAEAIRARCGK
jgi:hypothetical protein